VKAEGYMKYAILPRGPFPHCALKVWACWLGLRAVPSTLCCRDSCLLLHGAV
jgi:hypothetical protein